MHEFANVVKTRLWEANRRMQEEMRAMGTNDIMGSTLVAFLVHKREWMCLWAGDSRAYLLRDVCLTQLTRDHNVAQEKVERDELDGDAAADDPSANRITRAVGIGEELYLDEYRSFLRDGDAVLLCSDGLNKEVDDREVEYILESFDCQEASQELVDLTLERGACDNVTVAVIHFEATTGFGETRSDDTDVNYGIIEKGTGVQGHRRGLYPRLETIKLVDRV